MWNLVFALVTIKLQTTTIIMTIDLRRHIATSYDVSIVPAPYDCRLRTLFKLIYAQFAQPHAAHSEMIIPNL